MNDFFLFAVFVSLVAAVAWTAFKYGRTDERSKNLGKTGDAVEKSLAARDRLKHDGSYAERVRKRFTR